MVNDVEVGPTLRSWEHVWHQMDDHDRCSKRFAWWRDYKMSWQKAWFFALLLAHSFVSSYVISGTSIYIYRIGAISNFKVMQNHSMDDRIVSSAMCHLHDNLSKYPISRQSPCKLGPLPPPPYTIQHQNEAHRILILSALCLLQELKAFVTRPAMRRALHCHLDAVVLSAGDDGSPGDYNGKDCGYVFTSIPAKCLPMITRASVRCH
jgi:hypothetical protein